jgi:transcriptional activator of cad operon
MRFVFDDIVVDCDQMKLTKHEKNIECEPRVFELLVYLCQHPQEAISREELLENVWGGRVVSDAAVNRAVGELRKLIEDNPSSPQFIKTVSKVGYRLATIPTLFQSKDYGHQKQHYINQSSKDLFSKNIAETTQFKARESEHNDKLDSTPLSVLRERSLSLFFICLLLMLVIYKSITSQSDVGQLAVSGKQPVTSTKESAFNPSFNAKSNTLVFLYRENSDANAQLFVKKENEPTTRISDDDYYYTDALFGPDGFIYASRLNNLQQRDCEIIKIELITKRISSIIDCGKGVVTQLAFDENNRRLLYQYRSIISEPYAIYSYQLDTARKQQITHPLQVGNNTGDYVFAISPDNKFLAVVEYSSENVDKIKLVDLKDNRIIASAPFIDNVYGLTWFSDYQVFASNNEGLFEFKVEDLSLTQIDNSDQFGRLAMGPDKFSILTERSQKTVNIYNYSIPTALMKPLTISSGISRSPILGNISNILAFTSDRSGEKKIYIQLEGKAALTADFEGPIAHIGNMAWSPEDNKLVASINDNLYLYSLKNKKWQRLAKNHTNVHYVTFVDTMIMFSAEVDGQWNIWQLSLDNEHINQITKNGGYSVQGRGQNIYLTKFNYDGLYQLDLKTGIESMLIEGFPIAAWLHWQFRHDKIYYLLNKGYKSLDLITAHKQVIHSFIGQRPNTCNISYQFYFFACDKVDHMTSNIWQIKLSK